MVLFILIILSGSWLVYNFFTMIFPGLPYINIYTGGSSIIETLNIIAIRWSLPIGLLLVLVGVLGLIFRNKEENNFSSIKYPAVILGVLLSVGVIL